MTRTQAASHAQSRVVNLADVAISEHTKAGFVHIFQCEEDQVAFPVDGAADPLAGQSKQRVGMVRTWALAVDRMVDRYRASCVELERLDLAAGLGPSDDTLKNAVGFAWSDAHCLVIAAHQLHLYTEGTEFRDVPSDPSNTVRTEFIDLRNSLEHLSEAVFDEHAARPDPGLKRKKWALEKLPYGRLRLWVSIQGEESSPFDLVATGQLQRWAQEVLARILTK